MSFNYKNRHFVEMDINNREVLEGMNKNGSLSPQEAYDYVCYRLRCEQTLLIRKFNSQVHNGIEGLQNYSEISSLKEISITSQRAVVNVLQHELASSLCSPDQRQFLKRLLAIAELRVDMLSTPTTKLPELIKIIQRFIDQNC